MVYESSTKGLRSPTAVDVCTHTPWHTGLSVEDCRIPRCYGMSALLLAHAGSLLPVEKKNFKILFIRNLLIKISIDHNICKRAEKLQLKILKTWL